MADIDLFHHAKDSTRFDTFETIGWGFDLIKPEQIPTSLQWMFPYGFTKFMLLELVAAALVILFVLPVVRRLRSGDPPRGLWANAVEGLLLFIRDEVARPSIPDKHDHHGDDHHVVAAVAVQDNKVVAVHVRPDEAQATGHSHPIPLDAKVHRADYYLPLLWTLFLFILFCNLLGLLPFSGSPTASIMVTGALSLITFIVIHAAGVINNGWTGYAKSFIPPVEGVPYFMKVLIQAGVYGIEIMSLFIRNFVLAVRLFANMVGGHTALFLILLFIQLVGTSTSTAAGYLFWPVTVGSVLLVTAMSMLELFVALLQAYVFTMLTATFIGLAVAPEH
jgi:F-type H+-transporting ATPase subunit a